jgi:hypothetical protein
MGRNRALQVDAEWGPARAPVTNPPIEGKRGWQRATMAPSQQIFDDAVASMLNVASAVSAAAGCLGHPSRNQDTL